MSITADDIDKALRTLKSWRTAAQVKKDSSAEAAVNHVEKVIRALTGK